MFVTFFCMSMKQKSGTDLLKNTFFYRVKRSRCFLTDLCYSLLSPDLYMSRCLLLRLFAFFCLISGKSPPDSLPFYLSIVAVIGSFSLPFYSPCSLTPWTRSHCNWPAKTCALAFLELYSFNDVYALDQLLCGGDKEDVQRWTAS